MRSVFLMFLLAGCPAPGSTDATDPTDTTDSTDDTDPGPTSPWTVHEGAPTLGAWPAVAVLGAEIHVVPSNSTTHHVYDTLADTWTTAAPLPQAAHYHTGAAAEGTFYVLGGGSPGAIDSVDRTYRYYPGSDRWEAGPPLPTPRGYVTSAVVGEEVFVIGGPNVAGEVFNRTIEALDVTAGTWRAGELLPRDTMWPLYSAIAAVDGKIYRIGGGIANRPFVLCAEYDVAADSHRFLTPLPSANHGPAGAALGQQIYVMGGYAENRVLDSVWRYDIGSDSFEELDALPYPVSYSKAVTVGECIYVVGGHDNANEDAARTLLHWCPSE